LSAQLANADRTYLLKGVPTSPKEPRINHLFFADGSLLFCKTTSAKWHLLEGILELYERASGQMLNRDKTYVFFSRNTDDYVKEIILRLAGVPATQRYNQDLINGVDQSVHNQVAGSFNFLVEQRQHIYSLCGLHLNQRKHFLKPQATLKHSSYN
jgi:hypothetical protein